MDGLKDRGVIKGLDLLQIQIYIFHPFVCTKRKENVVRHNLKHLQIQMDNLICSQSSNRIYNINDTSTLVHNGLQKYQDKNLFHNNESLLQDLLSLQIKVYSKELYFQAMSFFLFLNQKMLSMQFFLPKLLLLIIVPLVLLLFPINY